MMLSRELKYIFFVILWCSIGSSPVPSNIETPTVQTISGKVKGSTGTSLLGKRIFYSYRAIPYAKPPIGLLRFKPPQPVDPWNDILNASAYGPQCLQTTFNLTEFTGEENCLFLNVFTPNITPNKKLAVIFYIHGGGYMSGSGNWMGPEILLDEDIILVTINYRLGPFGFLSLETDEYPGNMGLKDQLLALKWTFDNIEYFGGDKNRITLFGQSAGASAVHLLTLIPQTKGLFRRAIISSGSMLNPWAYSNKNHTKILCKLLANKRNKSEDEITLNEIINMLSTVDGHSFGEQTFSPVYESGKSIKEIDLVWAPVIEKKLDGAIIAQPIENYLQIKTDIDSLFGYTSAESIILAPNDINHPDGLKTFDERFEIQLPLKNLTYNYFSREYDDIVKDVRKFYFDDKSVNREALTQFVNLLTDVFFIYGIDKSVKMQAQRSTGKTFYYQFSVELDLNYLRKTANASIYGLSGATHIEDMLYLFKMNVFVTDDAYEHILDDSLEGQMIRNFSKFIVNFVNNGNLNVNSTSFKPIENGVINSVDITNYGFIAKENPHAESIQFWNEFIEKHKDILQKKI